MKKQLEKLDREKLQEIILKMSSLLPKEQYKSLEKIIEEYSADDSEYALASPASVPARMSQEFVDEKLSQFKEWMNQIDEGELYLDTEEYEDYSSGYWDADWVTEYFDNQGIGDKLTSIIRFAKDCVDDRRYKEARLLYEWLWEMNVSTDSEWGDDECVDLELLVEEEIIHIDVEQTALLTLYADYQMVDADKRAADIYLYFSRQAFRKLHIEDMFYAGRENLAGREQFWEDWIALLRTKNGDTEARLLREAVLYYGGAEGLLKMADENYQNHPSLYLSAMEEYDKMHDYAKIEEIGKRALEKIDDDLVIRGEMALKAAYASSCLMHEEEMMRFCWEAFRSDTTDRNFLRLFGTKEMAERYGLRGKEVVRTGIKGKSLEYTRNTELRWNIMEGYEYDILSFYTGDFERAKSASKNPKGSLGWSGSFIRYGIRLFLLYLYEKPFPSKAAVGIANYLDFSGGASDIHCIMGFESDIEEESREHGISVFWNYFQRWKQYFPIEPEERKRYLNWAEKIVRSRADAIVSGQHRGHYGASAELLAVMAEVKEDMGTPGAKREIFAEYKRKFPRHSSFQAEMKKYFTS